MSHETTLSEFAMVLAEWSRPLVLIDADNFPESAMIIAEHSATNPNPNLGVVFFVGAEAQPKEANKLANNYPWVKVVRSSSKIPHSAETALIIGASMATTATKPQIGITIVTRDPRSIVHSVVTDLQTLDLTRKIQHIMPTYLRQLLQSGVPQLLKRSPEPAPNGEYDKFIGYLAELRRGGVREYLLSKLGADLRKRKKFLGSNVDFRRYRERAEQEGLIEIVGELGDTALRFPSSNHADEIETKESDDTKKIGEIVL